MSSDRGYGSWRVLFAPRLWIAGAMGFASGLPLLLTLTVLQAWLTQDGVSLTAIGFAGLVGLPYTVKFLWAPLLDRFVPFGLGRRRGWLVLCQLFLAASIALLGMQSPREDLWFVAAAALLVAFCSASLDIVVDAYRRESLADSEQGLGASMYTYGYRTGMLLTSAGGLILADIIGFRGVYLVMAVIVLSMALVAALAPEPAVDHGRPRTLREAFIGPFIEFFTRHGRPSEALLVLVFIVIYKLGDNLASHMTIPFYLATGFSNTEIGAVVKGFGLIPLFLGVFIGGASTLKLGLYRALLIAGVLQGVSTAGFALLAVIGDDLAWLAAVVAFENLTQGMGLAALLAFMAFLTDTRFTAAQFALLSALTSLPRVLLTAPTGWLASQMGWVSFFVFDALVAIPGLLLLFYFKRWFPGPSGADAAVVGSVT